MGTWAIVLAVSFPLVVIAVVVLAQRSVRQSPPGDSPLGTPAKVAEKKVAEKAAVGAGTTDGTESGPATSPHATQELPISPAAPQNAEPVVPRSPLGSPGPDSASSNLAPPAPPPATRPAPATEPVPAPITKPELVPPVLPATTPLPGRTLVKPTKPKPKHTMRFDSAGETSRGPRERNDDTWLVRPHLLVIADGVGGKPAGKTAADLAVRTFRDTVDTAAEFPERELVSAVELAHYAIVEQSRRDPAKTEMACTLDAASLHPDGLVIGAHVGDSRVYYRPWDGLAVPLTTDEAVEGALLQSLGGVTTQVKPETWKQRAQPGDRVVLATDGLWSALTDTMVTALIMGTKHLTPPDAARVLVETGLYAGATDNVTVVVADVVELDPR